MATVILKQNLMDKGIVHEKGKTMQMDGDRLARLERSGAVERVSAGRSVSVPVALERSEPVAEAAAEPEPPAEEAVEPEETESSERETPAPKGKRKSGKRW